MTENSPKKANIHAGHRGRMRERYVIKGFDAFSDHECLEYMLFNVMRRGNTNFTAHDLIDRFGSLEGVINAPREELVKIDGVGEKMADYICSLGERMTDTVVKYFAGRGLESEHDAALLADVILRFSPKLDACALLIGADGALLGVIRRENEWSVGSVFSDSNVHHSERCLVVYSSNAEYISDDKAFIEVMTKRYGEGGVVVRCIKNGSLTAL